MQQVLLISLGAVLGANLRQLVAHQVAARVAPAFPYGTLVVNVTASFVLGFVFFWTTNRMLDPRWRVFLAVGFCASYSTYSSYAFESMALWENGQWAMALWNVAAMNVLCFVAVALGAALARSL